MNKTLLYSLLAILIIIVGFLIINETQSTFNSKDKDFAIIDTASVTKIFLADMKKNTVLLEKDSSKWIINKEYIANNTIVKDLLRTMMYVTVKTPVASSARDNVVRFIASNGIKVEIYQKKHLIDFWKIKLFEIERKTKTYYVGDNSQDNEGTYMIMENSEIPFITYIPGFFGFLHTRYSTNIYDWRDHTVFKLLHKDIESVTLIYTQDENKSFRIENIDNQNFKLYSYAVEDYINDFDTNSVINYLSGFYDLRFEFFVDDNNIRDSLLINEPYQILKVVEKNGNYSEMFTYLMPNRLTEEEMEARFIENSGYLWDREREWAFVNDGNDLVSIQYFVFDRVLLPIDIFLNDTTNFLYQNFELTEITDK